MNFIDLTQHAIHLGGLQANFHSLEFILRAFLYSYELESGKVVPLAGGFYSFPVSSEIPKCALTNCHTLRNLVEQFNKIARAKETQEIDLRIVEVRNALAHGRVSSPDMSDQLRLISFENAENNQVRVTFNEVLTVDWFTENKKMVLDAIQIVQRGSA